MINQPTEYSCFHDDHASPQALIPVIPSVLVLWRREWDSNPRMLLTSPDFKAGAFDHSAISPFNFYRGKAAATVLHHVGETGCGGLADKFGSFLAALLLQ